MSSSSVAPCQSTAAADLTLAAPATTLSRAAGLVFVAVAVVFAGFLALAYWRSWHLPGMGLYHDDGVYLVTAKALAEGKGYLIESLPSGMAQTKYPFLFPGLLSLMWRLSPEFPANLMLLKAVPLLCALLWYALAWRYLEMLGASRQSAIWIVLLTAATPSSIYLATNLMTEPLFALLCTGALMAALQAERGRSSSVRFALLAGVLGGLAFLTRTIGFTVVLGPLFALLLQRRFRAAVSLGGAGLAISALWPLWTSSLHQAAPTVAQAYYASSNYLSWNILLSHTWPEKIRVVLMNLVLTIGSPATLLNFQPLWLGGLLAFALLVLYAVRCHRARPDSLHLFLALYVGVVLCWAWTPDRFLLVVLPILLFFMWRAVMSSWPRQPQIASTAAVLLGLVAAVAVVTAVWQRLPVADREGAFPIREQATENWGQFSSAMAWIQANTQPEDTVLSSLDPVVYLYTGRKASRPYVPDSYQLLYAENAPAPDSLGSLADVIRLSGASILLDSPEHGLAEAAVHHANITAYRRDHPGILVPVDRPGADPAYVIYRIVLPPKH